MLEPLGDTYTVREYVDVNHAVNVVIRRYSSGIIIYVNNFLVILYSKRHKMVKHYGFRPEFFALWIAT